MKNLFVVFLVAVSLVGCSDKEEIQSFDKDIDNMRVHMEAFAVGSGDYEALEKDVKAFNEKLNSAETNDEMGKKFVEYQLKANEARLKGIKNMDSDLITNSSEYQYLANSAYGKINN